MSFEERLLMELKEEINARGERRRRTTVRRLFAGLAVAGVAAATAVAVPLLTGAERPAYAVEKETDGTIMVTINEFRDADKLEADLAGMGVIADVSYLPRNKECRHPRGRIVDDAGQGPGAYRETVAFKAARPDGRGIRIDPTYIKKGQTLLMEVAENGEPTAGVKTPQWLWRFTGLVIQGPVAPCTQIDTPEDTPVGPEGQPPAGS